VALRDYIDATTETARCPGKQLCNLPQNSSDSSRNCHHAASFGIQQLELFRLSLEMAKEAEAKQPGSVKNPAACELSCFVL
jgi:hypothetical protein